MISVEAQKQWFKKHKATYTDLGNIKILDFKNLDSCCYHVRFVFDESVYKLYISGDLGELVATNYSNMTYEGFKDFVHNAPYFLHKIDCHSRDIYEYDENEARKELKEHIKEYELKCPNDYDSIDECIEDILDNFDYKRGISEKGYDVLSDLDSDCWEWCGDLGKQSTGIIETYLLAFELATEQLKNKE